MSTELLLLDTHCWLWAQLGDTKRLSRAAVSAIRDGGYAGTLRVSVISIWELGMLVRRGQLALPMDIRTWVRATARALNATLLTKDQRIIQYSRHRHVKALAA